MDETESREDHFLLATLSVLGTSVHDVPCKLFLPKTPRDTPLLLFTPSAQHMHVIASHYEFQFSAESIGLDKRRTKFTSPCVYLRHSSTKYWGAKLTQSTASGEPQDLHIVKEVHLTDECLASLTFSLSPSAMLSPICLVSTSCTGAVNFEAQHEKCFDLGDGMAITFRRHYVELPSPPEELRRTWYLVGECKSTVDITDVSAVKSLLLEKLDDFLAVVSLASRQRTACLGWTAYSARHATTFYRGHFTVPTQIEKFLHDDSRLIPASEFQDGVQAIYLSVRSANVKRPLLSCMYALTAQKKDAEAKYLSLFASLEGLVLMYGRANSMEHVVQDDEKWRGIENLIKKAVKSANIATREERKMIYEKMPELNRVRFETVCSEFMAHYEIDVGDLWPLFGPGSLATIRNLLIHGAFPEQLYPPLSTAIEHLAWLVERAALRVAGWNLERSQVRREFLQGRGFTAMQWLGRDHNAVAEWCKANLK